MWYNINVNNKKGRKEKMIKALFKELQRESKKAKVVHYKYDNSIMIKFESDNIDISIFVDNVKELINHKTVAIVKTEGKYRPLFLCDIEFIRNTYSNDVYIYEATIQVNNYFYYNEIFTDEEINKELSSYTVFSI